jgi:hypothetical protein
MSNRPPYKPGPSQIARYKANTMPKHEDLVATIEHQTVFGEFPTDADNAALKEIGSALKFDGDKLPLHLLSTEAMNQTAAVLKFGAQKYAEHNWRKGFTWSRPLSAAMRHITAFNAGEDKDPESGLSHLAHAACCIMFLLEFEKTHPHLDDRYKPNVQATN